VRIVHGFLFLLLFVLSPYLKADGKPLRNCRELEKKVDDDYGKSRANNHTRAGPKVVPTLSIGPCQPSR